MPTVTSLDDLKTRVESGYTQRAYKEGKDPSGEEGSSIAQFLLGFDDEDEVDNTTVSILKPMYQAFLIDIQTKREQSYFSETVMSLSKDSAEKGILLLRFLQYPSLVRRARLESLLLSAWSAPNQPHSPIPQDFPLLDIAEDIALNGTIGAFCRKVISTNEEYHASILSSAITLLSYVGRSKLIDTSPTSSSKQEKSFVREIIFQGKSDSFGFSALRNDLALIAKSRFDLSARTISSLITLQINVLILILECKLKAQEIMDNDDDKVPEILPGGNTEKCIFYKHIHEKFPDYRNDESFGGDSKYVIVEKCRIDGYIFDKYKLIYINPKIKESEWYFHQDMFYTGIEKFIIKEHNIINDNNELQYFDNVPEVAWNFYIGGYQPAQKWLKDRKGRKLSIEDIKHWQRIIVALTETDKIMKEIDKIDFFYDM